MAAISLIKKVRTTDRSKARATKIRSSPVLQFQASIPGQLIQAQRRTRGSLVYWHMTCIGVWGQRTRELQDKVGFSGFSAIETQIIPNSQTRPGPNIWRTSSGRSLPLCSTFCSAWRSFRSNYTKERDTTANIEWRLVTRTSFLRHAFTYTIHLAPFMDQQAAGYSRFATMSHDRATVTHHHTGQ